MRGSYSILTVNIISIKVDFCIKDFTACMGLRYSQQYVIFLGTKVSYIIKFIFFLDEMSPCIFRAEPVVHLDVCFIEGEGNLLISNPSDSLGSLGSDSVPFDFPGLTGSDSGLLDSGLSLSLDS